MPVIGEPERVHYQSAAFRTKLFRALATLHHALQRAHRPYVAFSGGKDSTAVLVLTEMLCPGIHIAWSDDELELPETITYMMAIQQVAGPQFAVYQGGSIHANWFVPWADRPFWRDPLPGMIALDCPFDRYLDDQGYDLTILGLRMEENRRRRNWLAQAGPTYGGAAMTRRCNPIWDWSADDVWALIAGQNVSYNPAYDRMDNAYIPRKRQRVGPLPLVPRDHLEAAWPDLLPPLLARYGPRW